MVCQQGKEELSQSGHFADKVVKFFAILCGHLLWTAPYCISVSAWKPTVLRIFRFCVEKGFFFTIPYVGWKPWRVWIKIHGHITVELQ